MVRSSASVLEGTTKETELDPAMTAPPSDDLIDRMKLDMHYLRKMHDVKDIALSQATAELADATALIAKLTDVLVVCRDHIEKNNTRYFASKSGLPLVIGMQSVYDAIAEAAFWREKHNVGTR